MADKEIWKDIKGYEGLYQVSDSGRVKSLPRTLKGKGSNSRGCILKQFLRGNRYLKYCSVGLCKNGKCKNCLVHNLVYEAFIGIVPDGYQINHKDENPMNNHLFNLELCTPKYNSNYGGRNERIKKQKTNKKVDMYSLDNEYIKTFFSIGAASRETNISTPHICQCCKGKRETAGGFKWRYAS